MMKKIAVVGAGISGLTAAWVLGRDHEVVVFEADARIGGHTCTVPVKDGATEQQVDVGFIVFNNRTYPNFEKLLGQLGVGRQPAEMGFAISCERTGVEYCGDGLGGLFAQKRNLLSPSHWRMILDILRFNRSASALLNTEAGELPLGEYLRQEGYSRAFLDHYILPMGGAIWSCSDKDMEAFPAKFFVRFFDNHGLLTINNRPQWYVVPGGSTRYVEKLLAELKADVRAATPVLEVSRQEQGVTIRSSSGVENFDEVIFACHSDQALALLADANMDEKQLLGNIPYQNNEVVLHTDTRLLPRSRRAWSSWNALLPKVRGDRVQVTYNMNILQGIKSEQTWCVTLNATDRIDPQKIVRRFNFSHPLFTQEGMASRGALLEKINGNQHTWFCGAWCRNGFHEDGVVSALNVAAGFGAEL
ncbi:MAG: FAD-dependent oxidoreductase [Gammaproteobacteria bacterium HGW-Gammaproteobacteria-14]|nr:MAG: FAD-dependent oxidoreductase [Gammaproteobacteria bacterium HGW-Gammaproteobacteria-14]